MKKIILVFGILILASGCMYQTMPNGITKVVPAAQVGANVLVLDLCGGDPGILYGTAGRSVLGIRTIPGQEFWVAMPSQNGLETYSVSLTYVAVRDGTQIGSVSQSFPVNHYRGSQRFQWVLTPDRSGGGGGRNVYIDRCPRSERR
jgi:hypothetical protein